MHIVCVLLFDFSVQQKVTKVTVRIFTNTECCLLFGMGECGHPV